MVTEKKSTSLHDSEGVTAGSGGHDIEVFFKDDNEPYDHHLLTAHNKVSLLSVGCDLAFNGGSTLHIWRSL